MAALGQRSTEVIRHLYQQSGGRVPLIGVGAFLTPTTLGKKSLPALATADLLRFGLRRAANHTHILKGLTKRLAREGFTELAKPSEPNNEPRLAKPLLLLTAWTARADDADQPRGTWRQRVHKGD
ncbi:MAG: hypothetical protein Ct9H300mP32_2040 [Verrucomicrobiota bacterium]|nr:MAG: hypothetical protein Ct9H300mP32_2040 [Verrucomicrobiota bacterium]